MDTTASAMNGRSITFPREEATAVACGGCACTTTFTSGRRSYTARWRASSPKALPLPITAPLPSTSITSRSVTSRLLVAVGVAR